MDSSSNELVKVFIVLGSSLVGLTYFLLMSKRSTNVMRRSQPHFHNNYSRRSDNTNILSNTDNSHHQVSSVKERFEVCVQTDRFKFNAAHFIAYEGYRERLHGHNYSVSLRLIGDKVIGEDGYLIDFGEVKKTVSQVCAELNEHFIFPNKSKVLSSKTIATSTEEDDTGRQQHQLLEITCQDGTTFVFPAADCISLPIYHSSAEEIAWFLWHRVVHAFTIENLSARGIHSIQVTVSEAPNQSATYLNSISQADATPSFPSEKLKKCS